MVSIEPGYLRSELLTSKNRRTNNQVILDYEGTPARATRQALDAVNLNQPGEVEKGAGVVVDVLSRSGTARAERYIFNFLLATGKVYL